MSGEMEILFSLTGRMHVLLRRETNRIIDVEWMCADAAYAREVLRLVSLTQSDELHKLAERIHEVHPELIKEEYHPAYRMAPKDSKYMSSLR